MTTEHKPDPEFVEYLESQVKNPHLSAATVMQMERVFKGDGPEEVRAAYKVARKQAHPDNGGTDEQFHKVQ